MRTPWIVNALQRHASVIVQKSLVEGHRPGDVPAADRRAAERADRELPARVDDRVGRMYSSRGAGVRLDGPLSTTGSRPRVGAGLFLVPLGAGLPIYWNDMPHSAVQLKLDRSGGVTAFCGAAEIGQGSDDVLVACVAEILGIEPFDIRPVTGDTD